MAAKKTPWLTYALLAGGAYASYVLYQKYKATGGTPGAPGVVPNTSTVVPSLPAPGGQSVSDQVLSPVPSQQLPVSTVVPNIPNGIDPAVYSVVQGWAMYDNRAPVLNMAAAGIPSEYAGMYDIITNYWDKNIAPGAAQLTFWNALRQKYDPGPPPDQIW
jgi:hypothetical protein